MECMQLKEFLLPEVGMTSHAAVVARGMGKPCVSGSSEIKIDYENKLFRSNEYIRLKKEK